MANENDITIDRSNPAYITVEGYWAIARVIETQAGWAVWEDEDDCYEQDDCWPTADEAVEAAKRWIAECKDERKDY